jgi:phytoene/squalene synthetase
MRWEVGRAREFLLAGRPLLCLVGRRLRFELDLTIRGGLGILRKIERAKYDVLARRPALGNADKLGILLSAAMRRSI